MAICEVCFRHCDIPPGGIGFCLARGCAEEETGDAAIRCLGYGAVTSIALDPIEKKPLARFFPGRTILSVGSFGCNLRCLFCQNHEISWGFAQPRAAAERPWDQTTPEELAALAASPELRARGNLGVAFTYNEPLVGYEFVRDTARLVREHGLKNVLVTNGTAAPWVLEEILPFIDAMNIDLKSFRAGFYRDIAGGDLEMTMDFIRGAVGRCHVELTTLIVPGENDTEDEMRQLSSWVAALPGGADIPLHISRFFPRFYMTDRPPTEVGRVYRLVEVARERLRYVYPGNC